MPPAAFSRVPFFRCAFNSSTSSRVAPALPKPVEVLRKSAPEKETTPHRRTFSSSVRLQVSMMTFRMRPLHTPLTRLISDSTRSNRPSFTSPRLTTISSSSAPSSIAAAASQALTSVLLYPLGKPITVQTGSSTPSRSSSFFASRTRAGATQTDAVRCRAASAQRRAMSAAVAVGESCV